MNEQTTPYICDCGHPESQHSDITRGYGTDQSGKTKCYECCANDDREYMRAHGEIDLYFVKRADGYHVTNWPGSLDFKITGDPSVSRHNFGRQRVDFWFIFDGYYWHGYQIGDYNEVAHCKKTKDKASRALC